MSGLMRMERMRISKWFIMSWFLWDELVSMLKEDEGRIDWEKLKDEVRQDSKMRTKRKHRRRSLGRPRESPNMQ